MYVGPARSDAEEMEQLAEALARSLILAPDPFRAAGEPPPAPGPRSRAIARAAAAGYSNPASRARGGSRVVGAAPDKLPTAGVVFPGGCDVDGLAPPPTNSQSPRARRGPPLLDLPPSVRILTAAPPRDCRYYVLWRTPRWPDLCGVLVARSPDPFGRLLRLFPGNSYESGEGVNFCRRESLSDAIESFLAEAGRHGRSRDSLATYLLQ
jgi:hypothetical protein